MRSSILVAFGTLAALWTSTASANLVLNGDFDSCDLASWSVSGNGVVNDDVFPNSAPCDAAFGAAIGDPDAGILSQAIGTIPGQSYRLAFNLQDESGLNANTFAVSFGSFVQSITGDLAPSAYTPFSFVIPGAAIVDALTPLAFQGVNDSAAWNLDDVSVTEVTSVPEPATLALLSSGLLGLGFIRRRKSKKA